MKKVKFEELGVSWKTLKALEEMNFLHATEIQAEAIPKLRDSELDFIGQAQTGTGKTAAFVIPILEKIDFSKKHVQTLILSPTRELANQIDNEIKKIGKYYNVESLCVYGGTGYEKQIKSLKKDRPQIVVGTPGRVMDLVRKKILKLDEADYCVLDEADEMLNMGFFEDVQTILELFKPRRRLVMFSATMPKNILQLINKSFNEYEMVKVKKQSLSNDDIEQKYFIVQNKHFREALARLIDYADDLYGIVFCKTKIDTNEVGNDLKKRGHQVEVLNGDMGQNERDRAMRNFKEKKVNILVCTDVAARGIDVNNLTHVFNYGLPQNNESYVHRIGRTGRAGMSGKAYTIVGPRNVGILRKIEKHINKNIDLGRLPGVDQLKEKVVMKEIEGSDQILSAILNKGDKFKLDHAFDLFKDKFSGLSEEELLQLMFTWKFNKVLRHYNNLPNIEADAVSISKKDFYRKRSSRGRRSGRTGGGSGRNGNSSRRNGSGGRSKDFKRGSSNRGNSRKFSR